MDKEYKRHKANEYKKKRLLKIGNKINNLKLSQGCSTCGYNKNAVALHYDHIKDKKYGISYMVRISKFKFEEILEEIKKCVLLCSNCHAVKTYNNNDYINRRG